MTGIIAALIVISFGILCYMIYRNLKPSSFFTFWHVLWIFLIISTLIFRTRSTDIIIENPVDSAALFRITIVFFSLICILISVLNKTSLLFIRRNDYLAGVFLIYLFLGLISTLYSSMWQFTIYKVVELLIDAILILIIMRHYRLNGIKLIYDINYVWLTLLLISAWFWVPIKPNEAIISRGVFSFILRGVFPMQDADMVSFNAALVLIVAIIRYNMIIERRSLYRWLMVFALISLIASQARTSIIGFLVAFIIVLFLLKKRWQLVIIPIITVIILSYSPFMDWVYDFFLKGAAHPGIVLEQWGGRLPWWKTAIGMIKDSPLIGYGFGVGGRLAIVRYYPHAGISVFNTFLEVALNVGIIGLIFFLIAYLGTFLTLIRNWYRLLRTKIKNDIMLKSLILESIAVMIIITFRAWTSHLGEHGLAMLIFIPVLVFAQLTMYIRTS